MLLVQKFPTFILHQDSPDDICPTYESHLVRRSARNLPTTSREGRFLFKFGAKQLQNLFLWASFLANTAGTGTIATTNSFNFFGKTINSALSLAYGDRGFIPPVIPAPVPPVLPVAPPVLPVTPPVLPVTPPVLPVVPPVLRPTLPGLPFIPPVTTTANGGIPLVISPITASVGEAIPPVPTVKNGNPTVTNGSRQTDESKQRQLLEEYLELEKRNQKILSEYNNLIKQQQKITSNQNEQWRQFLKQHNLMVNKFNDKSYINIPRVNEI
jgi:hypothetical protein